MFFLATENNKPLVVQKLLNAGANPNIRNNNHETVLLRGNYNHQKVLNVLLKEGSINEIFNLLSIVYFLATSKNFSDIAKNLIENRATNLNLKDNDGMTPLMNGSMR